MADTAQRRYPQALNRVRGTHWEMLEAVHDPEADLALPTKNIT
jgi:hypothetical protein